MFDKKAVACTGAGEQAQGRYVSSQRVAWIFAKVDKPGACVVAIGNRKRLWIDSGEVACKRRVTASVPGCNIVVVWPGQLSFCARPLAFF